MPKRVLELGTFCSRERYLNRSAKCTDWKRCKGTPYHKNTNRNDQLILDVISECDLINLTTKYTKHSGKLWTFKYPNGSKAKLADILVNKKWKNSALNCDAYNTFHAIGSDHRPATTKIRLSLRVDRIKNTKL